MAGFVLPDAPPELAGKAVRAWSAPVVIPTYEPMPADKNPMFLEKRVYQGSSGKVYPLPFVDRISTEKKDRAWQAIHIENEYVRLMILPELGGRIHVGLDKTNNYDFFYRQNVIKPALVGLAGPWISGGVEFNWPQHHRPSTFMPVDTHIEEHSDGSVTVWCSEHEPMNRMKGMHGVHLRPGSSLIELKARLYNRTELPQTFLWWANVAARVHEHYQSFFPPDVQYVADHAKRAMSRFPLCDGKYYGVDYTDNFRDATMRERSSAPDIRFPPTNNYPPNDLTRYANIPVPTSYMILGTKEDFFGGYDHFAQAGFVHVADHRIAPGKKQWTWGNHPFGYAWDRNLTDPDDPSDPSPPYRRDKPAPYIELMAGVFTDNQPDFSHLMPGETRSFSQYWYPIQKIGPAQKASERAALSLGKTEPVALARDNSPPIAHLGVAVTSTLIGARLQLRHNTEILFETSLDLSPITPFTQTIPLPANAEWTNFRLTLSDNAGKEILTYQPAPATKKPTPEPAQEPPLPQDAKTNEELYLIGLHLEQYRHATRMPEDYWREALKRDPSDARCNNALGLWHLRRGEFEKAVACYEKAIATFIKWNPNPTDGEAFYGMGIALRYVEQTDKAYEALSKATWNAQWQSAAHFALAQLDCLKERWQAADGHLDKVLRHNADHLQARHLKALVLLRLNRKAASQALLELTCTMDPTDFAARGLLQFRAHSSRQYRMDMAIDFLKAGFYDHAQYLACAPTNKPSNESSLLAGLASNAIALEHESNTFWYLDAYIVHKRRLQAGENPATSLWDTARNSPPDYCFPHRLEEIAILQSAIDKNPDDSRAPYYLGNLLYDKRRHEEAITLWEKAARLDRSFPTVWRNLGLAYYNILHDNMAAKGAYQKALTNSLTWGTAAQGDTGGTPVPRGDARILYERDQLWKRTREAPQARLDELEKYPDLVRQRDDLTIEHCTLLNLLGRCDEALAILNSRQFQPWEGGEGLALGQWARAHLTLGRKALWLSPAAGGSPQKALAHFHAALHPPENLGETWHLLQNNSELHYWAGMAAKACPDTATRASAQAHFETAARSVGDFQTMAVRAYSEASYWAGMALAELGRATEARTLFEAMLAYAQTLKQSKAKIDYFATSLPTMLIFEDDIQAAQNRHATLIEALALHGMGGSSGKDRKTARRLLNDLLAEDPAHALAADLLESLDWQLG